MWYHYILLLAALYAVAIGIYNMIKGYGYITSAIQIAVGAMFIMWAWNGINAPSPMAQAAAMMGGKRCWWK